jgi:hypothetical protein
MKIAFCLIVEMNGQESREQEILALVQGTRGFILVQASGE